MIPRRGPLVRAVRGVLALIQRAIYGVFFRVTVSGAENIPARGGFIIAANHESHLDMGLIKHGLGYRTIISLAAKDYFFDTWWKAWVIGTFTNLLPFNRKAGLKESLETAGQVLAQGWPLLLFPEGTRTPDGHMLPFKPSLGFLALNNAADVLPVFIDGAFEALPKGRPLFLPRRRSLSVAIGRPIEHAELVRAAEGLPNNEAYRAATALIEGAVRALSSSK